jgi:hypothetical protein
MRTKKHPKSKVPIEPDNAKATATVPEASAAEARAAIVPEAAAKTETEGKAIAATPVKEIPSPSPTELAVIAAALRQNEQQDFSALASNALSLWETCQSEIQKRNERLARPIDDLFASLRKPEKFPVPFKEFLELTLPKTRAEDQFRLYKTFLMDWHNMDDVADILDRHKKNPWSEWDFKQRAFLFSTWHRAYVSTVRSVSGSKRRPKKDIAAFEAKAAAREEEARQKRQQAIKEADLKLAPYYRKRALFLALC